jgi:hypothetical protein
MAALAIAAYQRDGAWVVLDNMGETGGRWWTTRGSTAASSRCSWWRSCCSAWPVCTAEPEVSSPAEARPAGLGMGLLALLAGASLIAPAVLAAETATGRVADGWSIAVSSAALFLLVMARMALLLRHVERQARQVRELARSDELTGLPNRRAWNDELPRSLARARRNGEPVVAAQSGRAGRSSRAAA